MAKRKSTSSGSPPGGYAFLTAASELGADLRPAFRVLMHLPDTRADMAAWLRERAVLGDPAVRVFFEAAKWARWDASDLCDELLGILDEHDPNLPRRPRTIPRLVLKTAQGYWTGWGFTDRPELARAFWEISVPHGEGWVTVVHKLAKEGVQVQPEFIFAEDKWRDLGPMPTPSGADPWEQALQRAKVVPGCAWIPISPARREILEHVLLLESYVKSERQQFEDLLRAAARFGHPLYTVYVDFSERQGWEPALREELVKLDLFHARFRDPPGDVPVLQRIAGPFRVVCSRKGFWTGAAWSPNIDEAEQFPVWYRPPDEDDRPAEEAKRRAEEVTGVVGLLATVDSYPIQRDRDGWSEAFRSKL